MNIEDLIAINSSVHDTTVYAEGWIHRKTQMSWFLFEQWALGFGNLSNITITIRPLSDYANKLRVEGFA